MNDFCYTITKKDEKCEKLLSIIYIYYIMLLLAWWTFLLYYLYCADHFSITLQWNSRLHL